MYTDLQAKVVTDIIGDYFNIYRGGKQVDLLLSLMFICIFGQLHRNMNWIDKGIKTDGCYLTGLRFADE